jgi:integrase
VTNGVLARNPCKGAILPRRGHREMQILNEQQVNQFLTVASHSRYAALFRLAITSGMRLSELRGLYWSDLDWFKGTLTVRRQIQDDPHKGSFVGAPKTRSSKRTIMLGQATLDELRRHQERLELEKLAAGDKWQENSLVFPSTIGTPFGQKNLHDEFSKVLTDADLPRIRFHDLRHTAASLMLNHGVPVLVVSQILGHSNPSVTLNVYAHCLVDMQHQAAGVMDQIVTPIPVDVPKKPVTIPRSGK